ncbi:MAG: hypothetical protein SVU32_08300 [Candidatus Nanohaloarchaea archaeon]|nr:hypothetical protein [Candidatus Nanohaloarchaea archaeon]
MSVVRKIGFAVNVVGFILGLMMFVTGMMGHFSVINILLVLGGSAVAVLSNVIGFRYGRTMRFMTNYNEQTGRLESELPQAKLANRVAPQDQFTDPPPKVDVSPGVRVLFFIGIMFFVIVGGLFGSSNVSFPIFSIVIVVVLLVLSAIVAYPLVILMQSGPDSQDSNSR